MGRSEIITHTRRNDEVNITWCGRLTDYDAVITDAPIAVDVTDLAVFDDVEAPVGTTTCHACNAAYMAL